MESDDFFQLFNDYWEYVIATLIAANFVLAYRARQSQKKLTFPEAIIIITIAILIVIKLGMHDPHNAESEKVESIDSTVLFDYLNKSLKSMEQSNLEQTIYITSIRHVPRNPFLSPPQKAENLWYAISSWPKDEHHVLKRIIAVPPNNGAMDNWFQKECELASKDEGRYILKAYKWNGFDLLFNIVIFGDDTTYLIQSPPEEDRADETRILKITGKNFAKSMHVYFDMLAYGSESCTGYSPNLKQD